jgi:plasmid stabilization system protein ParE
MFSALLPLSTSMKSGNTSPPTTYPVLFWPVGSYLIIYRAEHRPVEIVAVTQGSRDIPAFLRPRLR